MFKQQKIKHLNAVIEQQQADYKRLGELYLEAQQKLLDQSFNHDEQITAFIRDLREMDQLVYQMQTSGSPDQLRSAINRAWAITEKRMQAESKRIESVLIPEIKKAYLK